MANITVLNKTAVATVATFSTNITRTVYEAPKPLMIEYKGYETIELDMMSDRIKLFRKNGNTFRKAQKMWKEAFDKYTDFLAFWRENKQYIVEKLIKARIKSERFEANPEAIIGKSFREAQKEWKENFKTYRDFLDAWKQAKKVIIATEFKKVSEPEPLEVEVDSTYIPF